MSRRKLLQAMTAVTLIMLLSAACGARATMPTPAAVALTSTAEATAYTMRYRDPYLGFAVEYPLGWEVTEHWEYWEGPTPRPFTWVGFRSNLYMGGEQGGDGPYSFDVAVGEATRSTVTDTVAYHLHAMIPEVRDDIQTRCCMTVDREQAMELLGFPWGLGGCRRIVVLHNGRQYWLTFYPYNTQFNTPSDSAAREAFELFLRSFTFVPVTEFPTPTITPVPTPTS